MAKVQNKKTRDLASSGYYSDLYKEGNLFATIIRSPAASGNIKNISIENLPEDCYLFTANNIPGTKEIEFNNTPLKIFGYNQIAYTGEPIAILLAPDENLLSELTQKINISFDVESLETALKNVIKHSKHPLVDIHNNSTELSDFINQINQMPSLDTVLDKSHVEKNPVITIATREVKSGLYNELPVEEADKKLFGQDKFITKDTWNLNLENPKWQETIGAFCYMDGSNLHVHSPTKWVYFLQTQLANALNIKIEQIFVHKTKTTGIYLNGMWRTTQIAIQAALATYLTKKPVKLVMSQKDQTTFMAPGVKSDITYETATDSNGKIAAMKVVIDIDVGICNPFAQEITDRMCLAACNVYKPENLYIYANTHTSKNPPTSLIINNTDSQVLFAIENHMQKICDQTQNFPDDLRKINSTLSKANKNFPFSLETEEMLKTLEAAMQVSDFNRKYAAFHMDAIDRIGKESRPFFALPLRGIGLATGINGTDFIGKTSFDYIPKIEVTLLPDEKAQIHAVTSSNVIKEIWVNTVSKTLQIPKENVTIDSTFNLTEMPQTPDDFQSTIGITNELLKKACNEIQKKRFHQPLPITSKKALPPSARKSWNQETFSGNPFYTISYATTIVEVELNSYTFSETIKGIWMYIDCGELFDEVAAKRTVMLEVQQELSMLVKDKKLSCEKISINFLKSKNKPGQIGGLVHNTLPAAFSTALSLALTKQLTELPCSENLLFQLTKEREAETQS